MDSIIEHRVDRSKAQLITNFQENSDFVDLPASECVALVWELTMELWSLRGDFDAEQRLQRDVAALIRK